MSTDGTATYWLGADKLPDPADGDYVEVYWPTWEETRHVDIWIDVGAIKVEPWHIWRPKQIPNAELLAKATAERARGNEAN